MKVKTTELTSDKKGNFQDRCLIKLWSVKKRENVHLCPNVGADQCYIRYLSFSD